MTNHSHHDKNQVPIATTAALLQKSREVHDTNNNNKSFSLNVRRNNNNNNNTAKKKKKRPISSYKSTFSHNPMVMAMITNNRLTSCQEVTKMMQECRKSGAEDQVCQTAARYMESCLRH